jgi:membrane-associated phospholipid phosphatase
MDASLLLLLRGVNVTFPFVAIALAIAIAVIYRSVWFIVMLGVMLGVVVLLKVITRRVRPDLSDTASFPSGHAAIAVYLAGSVAFHPAACVWAAAVGGARIAERRHFVSDVLAGSIGALGAVAALRSLEARQAVQHGLERQVGEEARGVHPLAVERVGREEP